MLIDAINLNHLRIFESVYRKRSMTVAAKELHLTQSGVSQHIKSIEEVLGVQLFDRIRQRLVPTSASTALFLKISQGLQTLEQAIGEVRGGHKQLSGTVTVGVPIEFGNNVILPLLSEFGKNHPEVKFKFRLGFASTMNTEILQGSIDFAFIDDFPVDRRIITEKVYDEVLDLCIHPDWLKQKKLNKFNRQYFESLNYVEYQDEEPVLRMWFSHHLNTKRVNLKVKAVVMDVQGIARLILHGLGAGILPHHLLLKLQKEGQKIHRFTGCGRPLKNAISVASLRDRTHSLVAQKTFEWLKTALKDHQHFPSDLST